MLRVPVQTRTVALGIAKPFFLSLSAMVRKPAYLLACVSVSLAVSAGAVQSAQGNRPDPLAVSFAVCLGRYAAMRNDNWTFPGQQVDTEIGWRRYRDLFAAVSPNSTTRSAVAKALLSERIRARSQAARLLTIARHDLSARRAQLAAATLARHLRVCENMIRA